MNKIKRSGKLLKAAFAVLLREKKLLLFPLIASALAAVFALFFIAPIILYPSGHSYFSADHWNALADRLSHSINFQQTHREKPARFGPVEVTGSFSAPWIFYKPWLTVLFAGMYFVSMFLATFSNVAFYHEIMQALNGNSVSIRRGFRFAKTRWQAILLWSLFAGIVGYLIQTIQERVGILGKIVAGLIGFVWSVACVFIIPTLVRDTKTANPLKLLKNSAGTLRNTWGELIVGFVGLELAFSAMLMFAILVPVVVFGLTGFYLGTNFHWQAFWIVATGVGAMMLIALPLSWISSIVNPVYRCALYIYATEGVLPGTFDKELLDSAWKVK